MAENDIDVLKDGASGLDEAFAKYVEFQEVKVKFMTSHEFVKAAVQQAFLTGNVVDTLAIAITETHAPAKQFGINQAIAEIYRIVDHFAEAAAREAVKVTI